MDRTGYTPGRIKPILYFINSKGHILLLPTDEETKKMRRHMERHMGYMMMAADTLPEAERLQKNLQAQIKQEQESELSQDEQRTMEGRRQVRDRLYRRMNSASCPVVERDFIRAYLTARELKHDIFKRRFSQRIGHLDALEFDNPTAHVQGLLDKM